MASDRNTAIKSSQILKHTLQLDDLSPDALVWQEPIEDKDLTSAPTSGLSEGDRYIVGSSASGDWSGQDGKIAQYVNSSWLFYTPVEGWFVWIKDEDKLYRYTGASWTEFEGGGGAGDMLKSTYDIDEDGIVDKAETIDDGAGNSATAVDVKDAVTKKHTQNTDIALRTDKFTIDVNGNAILAGTLQIDGGDLKIGTSLLTLQTTLGTNTNTQLNIKGKGTGYGDLNIWNITEDRHIWIQDDGSNAWIGAWDDGNNKDFQLNLQYGGGGNIHAFEYSAEGETAELRVYGYPTGGALKYGFQKVEGTPNDYRFGTADGSFIFQTDEGTNTNTVLKLRGKGTGLSLLEIWDVTNDKFVYIDHNSDSGEAEIGAWNQIADTDAPLLLQYEGAGNISAWISCASGKTPEFRIYGNPTGGTLKYGSLSIEDTTSDFHIGAENDIILAPTGGNVKVEGKLETNDEIKIKVYSQDTEPTLNANDFIAIWKDTNDSNRIYLLFRRGVGDQVAVELA